MKKTITALLLSLVTVLCLTAVAWATEVAPAAPSKDDIMKLAKVKVSCVTSNTGERPYPLGQHGTKTYDLVAGTFAREDYEGNASEVTPYGTIDGALVWKYTFYLTEYGMWYYYPPLFEKETASGHGDKYADIEITLLHKDGHWQLAEDGAANIWLVNCSTIDRPTAPTPTDIAKGKVVVDCRNDNAAHADQILPLAAGTYYTDDTSMEWYTTDYDPNFGAWVCKVYLRISNQGNDGVSYYVDQFNKTNGKHLIDYVNGEVWFIYRYNATAGTGYWEPWDEYYDSTANEWVKDPNNSAAYIRTVCAPTAAELNELLMKLNVNVQCKNGTHTDKTYNDINSTSLNLVPDFKPYFTSDPHYGRYQYKVLLTDAAAKSYVANYSTAVGKTHALDKNDSDVTIYWSNGRPEVLSAPVTDTPVVYADPPIEADPDYKWMLTDTSGTTFTLTATDSTTTTGGTGGGFPFKDSNKTTTPTTTTVSSAKTFDAGAALYAGLAILSLTGSAMVIRKKEF